MMDLERLAAALGAGGRGRTRTGRDARSRLRHARPSARARCSSACRARAPTVTTSLAEAVARGAVALVVERPLDARRCRSSSSPDAAGAMALAADEFFGEPTEELEVAGVTGTNGKTTTTFLLYAILAAAGRRPGLARDDRGAGRRRAPRRRAARRPRRSTCSGCSARCSTRATAAVAMEATSHASALRRLDRVRFAALVFTNLEPGPPRLPRRRWRTYFEAKRRLFVEATPPAAVNVGDEYGRRLARGAARTRSPSASPTTRERRPEALDGHRRSKLRGRFNVENALGAVAAARLLGIDDDAIARGLESVARRARAGSRPIDEGQPFAVIVDYAHKPGALETRAARRRASSPSGRVICVFGCGGDRDREQAAA